MLALTLALALIRATWLCAPVHHWWWVLTPLVSPHWVLESAACGGWSLVHVASPHTPVGGGCSDPFVLPRWVLVSTIGGDGAGHLHLFVPLVVCSPLFVWPCCMAALLRVIMVVSVGGVLLDVYEMKPLAIG